MQINLIFTKKKHCKWDFLELFLKFVIHVNFRVANVSCEFKFIKAKEYQQMLSCRERDLNVKTNTRQWIDLLINHVFVSFFASCSPLLLWKPANQKSSSTFFLVSNFLCSFRINLELLKAGDAMSSPAIVSLTELTHTFLLFETESCCKKF